MFLSLHFDTNIKNNNNNGDETYGRFKHFFEILAFIYYFEFIFNKRQSWAKPLK